MKYTSKAQASTLGQGAIEYLLLMAAAVAVVAVVISYMIGILNFMGPSVDEQTLSGLCKPMDKGGLDQNTLLCGCYLKDSTRGEKNKYGEVVIASKDTCPEKLPDNFKSPLLDWK
jgi:hypothetical protein